MNPETNDASRDTLHGFRERRMEKGASLGKEAVLAASGRAGEKIDFFSILLKHDPAVAGLT